MELYGSQEPPEYDLSKITAKIHILYGTNDKIAPAEVSYGQPDNTISLHKNFAAYRHSQCTCFCSKFKNVVVFLFICDTMVHIK